MKKLILIGGGGHCKSVIDVAESAGYTVLGILDLLENEGKKVLNNSIIGSDNDLLQYIGKALFVVTVGHIKDASLRIRLHEKVISAGGQLATVVSPSAYISSYAKIGEGSVIMHQAVVNADAIVGRGCIINTCSNIEHEAVINDYCHISTGAMVNGNCIVGRGTFLGSQSVMVNGTSITNGCVVAAGAVIRKDILVPGVYSGNPAILKIKL